MVRARIGAGLAVLSAAAAVAFAGWVMTQPLAAADFFAPDPFRTRGLVAACGCVGLVWAVMGGLIVALRRRNALGWLVLGVGVSQAWAVGLTAYGWRFGALEIAPSWPAYLGPALYVPGWLVVPTLLLAFYPDGRLPGPRWRWPVGAAAVAIVLLTISIPFPVVGPEEAHGWVAVPTLPDRLGDVLLPGKPMYSTFVSVLAAPGGTTPIAPAWWPDLTGAAAWVFKPVLALSMLAIWVGTAVRLVRATAPRRQQLAWLVCVAMPFLAAMFAVGRFSNLLVLLSLSLVPVAVAVGALRYRMLGTEPVLRRGLVYGMFTFAVVGAYLLVTVTAGSALDHRPLPGAVAAALVAVALAPARHRLQRAADRLVYGERQDPMRAVTRLGQGLATAGELELLPGALLSVMAAVHAPGAAVAAPDGRTVVAVGVDPGPAGEQLPLSFGGHRVGTLHVACRQAGEKYSRHEADLIAALAPQVAVVVRALELTEALESERDRVVAATATERVRLRGDLHDGLGPSLSGIGLGLQALSDSIDAGDREASTAVLDRIREEVTMTLEEVRRIIDGLRPSALDTMELPDAIRRHARTVSTAVPVEVVVGELPELPAVVENAAYRITTEALTNAARHSVAGRVQVTLDAPAGALVITVADDGSGVGTATPGVGLTSMRRRAETLGGELGIDSDPTGTTVTATLPLEQR
ncbi:MAG TPA: sensor histidine kinase [Mycobacteriales bacterium]|nr:sensor histidine kinase [Mycobacteriales bacterium]